MSSAHVIERHRSAGRSFVAAGVRSFGREEGTGEPVVCIHGVPASSFLYRKVLAELSARGRRGIAFDLPGLRPAGRPAGFDYTWSSLGRFCARRSTSWGSIASTSSPTTSAGRTGSSWLPRAGTGSPR